MHDFRKLGVWKKARILVKNIYTTANKFPKEEVFGLISQAKRSAVSVPSNIAEGCGRNSDKQLLYHLNVALASAFELETQILLAGDLSYIEIKEAKDLVIEIQEVQKMIIGLQRSYK